MSQLCLRYHSMRQKRVLLTIQLPRYGRHKSIRLIVIYGLLAVFVTKCAPYYHLLELKLFLNSSLQCQKVNIKLFHESIQMIFELLLECA